MDSAAFATWRVGIEFLNSAQRSLAFQDLALAEANDAVVSRLHGVTDLHNIPGAERTALRLDVYLVGESLSRLAKIKQVPDGLDAAAASKYQKSLQRTKETLLKNNLFTLRTVIDEYTFDKQKAPQSLDDLLKGQL